MQAVTEFMKESKYIIMSQQGFLVVDRPHEIAGKISNRELDIAIYAAADTAFIHPGAIALVRARIKINIKTSAQLIILIVYREKLHVWMPDINIVFLLDSEPI